MRRITSTEGNSWRALGEAIALLRSAIDPYAKVRLMWAVAFVVGGAIAAALTPIALQSAVDSLVEGNVGVWRYAPVLLIAAYVGGQFLSTAFVDLRLLVFGMADQRLRRRMSGKLFAHVVRMPMRSHLSRKVGELVDTTEQGVIGYQLVLTHLVYTVFPVVIELAIVVAVLLSLGRGSYLSILGASAAAYVYVFSRGASAMRTPAQSASRGHIAASGVLADALVNCETIKYFGAEPVVTGRYDSTLYQAEGFWRTLYRRRAMTGLVVAAIFAGSLAWLLSWAAKDVAQGRMTVGEFVLINAYAVRLVQPLAMLGVAVRDIVQGLAFLDRMLLLLREPVESGSERQAADEACVPSEGALTFENVSFSYERNRAVLEKVSFSVAAGRTVAIVGASGSGKSSISRLLFRLYEVNEGRILLDGVPIADMALSDVRNAIAIVPQDTVLFHDTVEQNIAIARRGASRAEVEEAARVAHLHDFIVGLPEEYETVVGERGLKLSGGERQRIAIARAVLKRPRVFVFDELTSSLDANTEQEILRSLEEVSSKTTSLVIAHRLSTVMHADEILVLEKGAIVERGTHLTLLEGKGRYASLWRAQQGVDCVTRMKRPSVA